MSELNPLVVFLVYAAFASFAALLVLSAGEDPDGVPVENKKEDRGDGNTSD